MAKDAAGKASKVVKKKSLQDLKADAPAKAKKTKQVEDEPASAPIDSSSSKPKRERKEKKEKKPKDATKEATDAVKEVAEVEVPVATGKKDKKRKRTEKATAPEEAREEKANAERTAKEKKAKAKNTKVAEPESEPEGEEEDPEENEAEEQEFYGFESDDDDSSDEEMVDDIPGIDIGKLPTIAKDDATVKRKLEKAKRKPTEDRGVLYLGRLPHGFYEDQMKAYFSQFGNLTRLRLSRNKKTGKAKHYGFIEFDSSSVAQIVAETMDNYLLTGHILTCKVIPKDQVHPELWVGANRKWRPVPRDRVARVAHNKPRTEDELERAEARLLKRQEQRKRKLEEAGIKYDFEAVAYKKKPKPTEA